MFFVSFGLVTLILFNNKFIADEITFDISGKGREKVAIDLKRCTNREMQCMKSEAKINITTNLHTLENLYELAACSTLAPRSFICNAASGVAKPYLNLTSSDSSPSQSADAFLSSHSNWFENVEDVDHPTLIDPVWAVLEAECRETQASLLRAPRRAAPIQMPQLMECADECMFVANGFKKQNTVKVVEPSMRYKTCALVGSSGTLLLDEMGREIDEHDVVIRFNNAPTEGYEKHVGSKTTFLYLSFDSILVRTT